MQTGSYKLEEDGDTWQVTVPVGTMRKQTVTITFGQHDEGNHAIVSFRSTCGPATEQNAQALLRYNTKLVQGAFAFDKIGDREMVVLQATLMADALTGPAVSQVITAIAWQADKVEEKLTALTSFNCRFYREGVTIESVTPALDPEMTSRSNVVLISMSSFILARYVACWP